MSLATLAEATDVGLLGMEICPAERANGRHPLVVTLLPEQRSDLDALLRLPIRTAFGVHNPLGDFVLLKSTQGSNEINDEDVSCGIVISVNVSCRPLGPAVNDTRSPVAMSMSLPVV